MKFAIFSDLHVHTYKQFDVDGSRLKNSLQALRDVFNHCQANGIKHLFFAGDLYHLQKVLPTEAVNRLFETLQDLFTNTKVALYAISGNHDFAEKNLLDRPGVTALSHLAEMFPRFHLIDNQNVYFEALGMHVGGLPYYDYREHFQEALKRSKQVLQPERFNMLLIHQTPSGLIDFPIPSECDPANDFGEFDLVLCGHIHTRRKLADNFWLVGSPLAQSYQDPIEYRGFMVFEVEPGEAGRYSVKSNFIELDYPQFLTVPEGEEDERTAKHYVKTVPVAVAPKATVGQKTVEFSTTDTPKELTEKYFSATQTIDKQRLETGLAFV